MSLMGSRSRPSKHAATPPPIYLTAGGQTTLYCHTCGRVISYRKTRSENAFIKYCSDRCRHNKTGLVDRKIEDTFVSLLGGEETDAPGNDADATKSPSKLVKKVTKGDRRALVACRTVEELVFSLRHDPDKVFGRKKNRGSRGLGANDEEWKSVDMPDTDRNLDGGHDESEGDDIEVRKSNVGLRIRPPQTASEANGSIGGEKGWTKRRQETAGELEKCKAGQRRAEEREMVRRAARRACAFGLKVNIKTEATSEDQPKSKSWRATAKDIEVSDLDGSEVQRKCEAVMNGVVVEPSFAKGEWAIRWRE